MMIKKKFRKKGTQPMARSWPVGREREREGGGKEKKKKALIYMKMELKNIFDAIIEEGRRKNSKILKKMSNKKSRRSERKKRRGNQFRVGCPEQHHHTPPGVVPFFPFQNSNEPCGPTFRENHHHVIFFTIFSTDYT